MNISGSSRLSPKFFSFLRVRHSGPVGWISISSIHRRKIFESYSSSWKGFKPEYFKVTHKDSSRPFFLSTSGKPKFPLYWTSNPRVARGYEYTCLSSREKLEVSYIEQFAEVSCKNLVERANNPTKLDKYMYK